MLLNDRQNNILELLKDHESVSVAELARRFKVSEMTVRRDFDNMAHNKLITRTHGGCVKSDRVSFDLFMGQKMNQNLSIKTSIARKTATLVTAGDTLLLDTGTTVFQLSNFLDEISDLTIATPSLAVASNLFFHKAARLIVLGGYVKPWSPDLVGSLTEETIEKLHFKKAFLGADGIDIEDGFFCSDMQSANVVKAIIKASDEVYVMADSSKIGKRALIKYAGFEKVTAIVTDTGAQGTGVTEKVKTIIA